MTAQLRFVATQKGCGISVHSVAALNWLLKIPPPKKISVYLSRDVFNELAEAGRGGAPVVDKRTTVESRAVLPVRSQARRKGCPAVPAKDLANPPGR